MITTANPEKLLSGAPMTVEGITFRPYRKGIGLAVWKTDDNRVQVWQRPYRSTVVCVVDDAQIGDRYHTLHTAMRAGATKVKTCVWCGKKLGAGETKHCASCMEGSCD